MKASGEAYSPPPWCRDLPVSARHRGDHRRPCPRRVRRRPGRYACRQGPQELRRHLPADHRIGQKKTVHASWIRNKHPANALRAQALAASPAPGPATTSRAPAAPGTTRRSAASYPVPPDRHPARLPEDRPALQRGHRLVPPHPLGTLPDHPITPRHAIRPALLSAAWLPQHAHTSGPPRTRPDLTT